MNKRPWQFSLRTLFLLASGSAVLLSIWMAIDTALQVLYVIGLVTAAIVAVFFLFGGRTKRKIHPALNWGCLAPVAVILANIVTLVVWDMYVPSRPRRALPYSATQVQEYYSDCWNGDYIRLVKAKLPEADYPRYARNLGLTNRFDPIAHADIADHIMMSFGGPGWWTPPAPSRTTYFAYKRGDCFIEVLKYSEGYVYFVSSAW